MTPDCASDLRGLGGGLTASLRCEKSLRPARYCAMCSQFLGPTTAPSIPVKTYQISSSCFQDVSFSPLSFLSFPPCPFSAELLLPPSQSPVPLRALESRKGILGRGWVTGAGWQSPAAPRATPTPAPASRLEPCIPPQSEIHKGFKSHL